MRLLLLSVIFALAVACSHQQPVINPTVEVLPTYTPAPTETPTATATATPVPTATSTPVPTATPTPAPTFIATRYGESYTGQNMGCIGAGVYSSNNPTILAAPPARYVEWPCGTRLLVCFLDRCQEMVRTDSCPGCGDNHIDVSEAGLWYLAGCRCDILQGLTITVLAKPSNGFRDQFDEVIASRCQGIIDIRERRMACVNEVVRQRVP